MLKKINEYIKFSAKGKNLYKFINGIHTARIYCFNQYCKSEVFYGEVYKKNLPLIEQLAQKHGISLEIFEYDTLVSKLKKYKLRFGIVIGIMAFMFACFYFSNTVMTIEVNGNSRVKESVILSVLNDMGVKKGTYLNDINYSKCERELRIRIDKISWTAIRRTGNRIVVDVTEIVDIPEMLKERTPCNIISDKNAQITNVSVLDGQLMRIVGDYVRSGDILVSGIIQDSNGHITMHHSMADITGIYEEKVCFTQLISDISYESTGNKREEHYLNLFNLKIPLFLGRNKYELYSSDENTKNLILFGKKLPISFTEKRISENKYCQKVYDKEETDSMIMRKIFFYEKNFLQDKKILDRKIEKSENETEVTYNVTYSIEGKIGTQQDIYTKQMYK